MSDEGGVCWFGRGVRNDRIDKSSSSWEGGILKVNFSGFS